MTTTSERGYFTVGCSHPRPDRGWKGCSIGSRWWWCQLRYQESLAGHHSQETKETIKGSVTQPSHYSSCLLVRRDNGDDGERPKRVASYFHISRLLPGKHTKTEDYTRPTGAEIVTCSRGFWVPVCERYKRMELLGASGSYRRRPTPWEA